MKARGRGIVGYNVYTVVDIEHHLIVSRQNRGLSPKSLKSSGGSFQTFIASLAALGCSFHGGDVAELSFWNCKLRVCACSPIKAFSLECTTTSTFLTVCQCPATPDN
jgi:hypothetical protein